MKSGSGSRKRYFELHVLVSGTSISLVLLQQLHYENQMSQLTSRVAGSEGQLTEQIRRKDADIVALRLQVLHAKQAVGRAQNEQRSSEEHMQVCKVGSSDSYGLAYERFGSRD